MRCSRTIFAILAVFLSLSINSVSEAVSTRAIDEVRNKEVLDTRDLQIIDTFVAQSVGELVKTKDFTSIARIRMVILSRKSSNRPSNQGQYSAQFSESSVRYISEAFGQAGELSPEARRLKVVLNLLILVDGLEDVRLADLARGKLNDENSAIRYWAVHSVTNPGITEQLNSADNLKLASGIVEQLKELVESSCPEIIALIAEFAGEVRIPQAEDLLVQIADMRIKKYADWSVDNELLDAVVLKSLYSKISSTEVGKRSVARRFGQLYSYVIQRYVNGRDFLRATDKGELASVLVEAEQSYIGKLLGKRQSTIKKAVERSDVTGLLLEHNRLLGDKTRAGRLPLKLKFDYGQKPDGSKRIAPLVLPKPPKELIPSTKLRTSIDN